MKIHVLKITVKRFKYKNAISTNFYKVEIIYFILGIFNMSNQNIVINYRC